MAFSEALKRRVREKAAYHCVICHKPFVEVHHIIPQSEGGPDTENNAAPLCAGCHDLYGGNPEKRKQIREMRDYWYRVMEQRLSGERDVFAPIQPVSSEQSMYSVAKRASGSGNQVRMAVMYHCVYGHEDFNTSANILFKLVRNMEKQMPGRPRALYLDIEGHRNEAGGFDDDMFELQCGFILDFLLPYLTVVCMPLGKYKSGRPQENDLPERLAILSPM